MSLGVVANVPMKPFAQIDLLLRDRKSAGGLEVSE